MGRPELPLFTRKKLRNQENRQEHRSAKGSQRNMKMKVNILGR